MFDCTQARANLGTKPTLAKVVDNSGDTESDGNTMATIVGRGGLDQQRNSSPIIPENKENRLAKVVQVAKVYRAAAVLAAGAECLVVIIVAISVEEEAADHLVDLAARTDNQKSVFLSSSLLFVYQRAPLRLFRLSSVSSILSHVFCFFFHFYSVSQSSSIQFSRYFCGYLYDNFYDYFCNYHHRFSYLSSSSHVLCYYRVSVCHVNRDQGAREMSLMERAISGE